VDTLEAMHAYDLGLETTITFSRSEHQGSQRSGGTQLTETGKHEPFELQIRPRLILSDSILTAN
jgi:hypothetical protein